MTKWKGEAASFAPNLAQLVCAVSSAIRGALLPVLLLAGLGSMPAGAADLYWDVNGTAVGLGGTGAWNTSSLFWNPNSNGVSGPMAAWNNAAVGGDNAIFNGTAGTVTLAGPTTAHNLTFGVAGYTLAGSTLTLTGATPTISTVGATAISSILAGSAGITKIGAGVLTLSAANTFSGNVTVSGGGLALASDASLGNAGNGVSVANGTSISSTGALAGSRVVTIVSGRAVAASGALTARFTGAGGLQVLGTISNDANDYTGQTVFGQSTNGFTSVADLGVASSLGAPTDATLGTISVSAGGGLGGSIVYFGDGDSSNRKWQFNNTSSGGNTFQNSGTGTLTLTGDILAAGAFSLTMNFSAASADMDLLGVVSSTAARTVAFTGNAGRTITLGGANTYSGPTAINTITVKAGTLANSGSNSSLGAGSSISFSSGTLNYTGTGSATDRSISIAGASKISNDGSGALSFSGATTVAAGATLTLGGSFAGANTLSGAVSGAGNLTMNGAGTWLVSGNNSFAGNTTVQSGTLLAGSSTAFGAPGRLVVNGGTLGLNGFDVAANSLAGTGGAVDLGGNTLTVNGATGATAYAGAIIGSGGLTKLGASTLTLTGANTYTGTTSVGGGTLAVDFSAAGAPASNIISASSALKMSGGTLLVKGSAGANSQSFAGLTVSAGNNRINATALAGGAMTVGLGTITRTGGLVDFGIGTGTSMSTSNADGALGGWATVNGTDYAQVSGGFITAFTAYLNQDNAGLWANGNIVSDEGGAANTPYFGTVNGNVTLGGLKYSVAAASIVNVGAGNTLGVDGTIIVSPLTGTANQTIQGGSLTGGAGGSALGVQQNGGGTFTIASTIVDNGGATSFTVGGTGGATGTGVVALTGANSYTGATTVSGATLAFNTVANGGTASAIGASSSASSNLVLENGTLRYTGSTATTDRGFTLVNGGPSRTFDVSSAATNLTFTGQVTSPDDAGFTKSGVGTLTLTNANNDYVGVTTIAGGTLAVSALANGGLASGIGAASSASSNLVLQNGGTLSYIGSTTSSDHGFTLGTGGGGIAVAAGASLTLGGTATGSGALTKSGTGTLVLSGTNNYTGATTVSAGVLRAGSTRAFGGTDANGTSAGQMNVLAGATLDLANNNNTVGGLIGAGNVTLGSATLRINNTGSGFSGTISGTGGVTIAAGAQTFSGCTNSYTGGTTINGTLSVGCLRNGGQASDIGASSNASANLQLIGGTLIYTGGTVTTDRGFTLGGTGTINVSNAATTLGFSGVATGTSLQKTGPGTLVLSGANTYNGATYVNGGILRAGSTSAFGTSGLRMDTPGATLDLNNFNNTVLYISQINLGVTGGNITLGNATLTISDGSGGNYNGAISGSGGLVKNGAGAQSLSGGASSYSGPTVINGGILAVAKLTNGGSNSSIGASGSAASNLVLNGGVLRYNGTGDSTDRQFTLGPNGGGLDAFASGPGPINFTSTAPITMSGNGNRTLQLSGLSTADNSLSARIDNPTVGTTALTKTGTGTWVLKNQSSTYTGITTISGGVLAVDKLANGGQASSIGQSSSAAANLVIGTGSTLRYTGTGDTTDRLFTLQTGVSFIESSGTGAVVFSNTGSALNTGNGNRTLALGGTNTGLNTMGGSIVDGPGGLTQLAKNDSGTWVLTGNNSYSGSTIINDGNLMIGNGGTTGNAGTGNVVVVNSTSTLSFNRSDTFNFAGSLSGAGNIAQIGPGTTRLTSAVDSSIGGTTRVDAGTLQLASNLTSSGGTTVNAGTLQVDAGKTLTTPTLAMNAGSTLTVNGTVGAAAGGPAVLTGVAGASAININTGGTLRGNGDLGGGNDVVNVSGTLATGAAALNLGAGNDTLVLNDTAVLSGVGVNAGTGGQSGVGDTLQVVTNAGRTLDSANVTNFESLLKQGAGTLTLTGAHSYTAGTTISAGTLQVGNGAIDGALTTPTVANNGVLAFNLNSDYTFGGVISGSGAVNKLGTGTTTLTGTNTYGGQTNVQAGTLLVDGNQSGATGATLVSGGATLGGTGTIGGSITVADGGTLSPGDAGNAPGTLTINGNLSLGNSNLNVNFGQANVPGGALNDLVNVGGNLTLDGTLNVTQSAGGNFGPGVYRVINYNGSLTDNGLNVTDPNYVVQTSVANQVNLVNSAGLQLSYWDGDAGPHSNSIVNGGNGTWRAAGDQNWTESTGLFAAPFANASFAIFQGTAGTVTVDNTNGQVGVAGMQFATNGYVVQGGDIALVNAQSIIRVGDGSAASAGYTATIASSLTGTGQLVKTDAGTLILTGANNTYSGGTAINGGTVQIDADGKLGDSAALLSLDGGTLHTTANVVAARSVVLNAGGGTFDTDNATSLFLGNTIGGAGALTKEGGGTLNLTGANTYQGGTFINGGTVQILADANLGDAAGKVTVDGGTLHVAGVGFSSGRDVTLNAGGGTIAVDNFVNWGGSIDGSGALTSAGGFLALSGDSTYTGGTTIAGGILQLGNGGTTGSILGDVVNNGAMAFDRSNLYSFDGVISGGGEVVQVGVGTTVLTADNSYTGTTSVLGGSLYINGDQSAATGQTAVNDGGTLGGNGIIGGNVIVLSSTLAPGGVGTIPGTLTINGDLLLAGGSILDYSFGQAGVVGGAYNDLTVVHGNLTLDGTINVTEAPEGNFGPGIYRVISYDGTLADNGLNTTSPNHVVQTSVEGQVNLVDISGQTLNFWDGNAGPKSNDVVNGGDGTWRASGDDNWTDANGNLNAAFSNGSFAIFAGSSGLVTVDNTNGQVQAAGMQFATSGYAIQGQDIQLLGPQSTIRVGDGTLPGAAYTATIASNLTGATQLVKTDLGTLVLGGTNSYTGGTAIKGGTLQVSADANFGDTAGNLSLDDGTTLQTTAAFSSARNVTLTSGTGTVQTDAALTLSGLLTGAGGLNKTGVGALTLSGTNSYAGPTTVAAGRLYVDGDNSAATGLVSVASGATIGGKGSIGGDVTVADGGTLSPGSADGTPGTLAIAGNLNLSSGSVLNYSFGQADVVGGARNDLTTVGGNLVLDGTLNVTTSAGGTFGPGVYRVFSYDGTLTNNGLAVGTIPSTGYSIQTSIDHQVNLVNTEGLTFNFWDGNAGPKNNGVINGGDGVWQTSAGNDNWTNETGTVNAPFADASFAIFAGQAGTVTVDDGLGQVTASGMQFMTDGYVVQGGGIELTGPSSSIVVGDGTAAGAGMTATIASVLSGDAQLVKSDRGTLVLTGTNTYTGGTAINGGTLQVSTDANLGDAAGGLSFDGGTLHTTDSFATSRAVNVMSSGTISTAAATTLTLNGALTGSGAFTKAGDGTLVLASGGSAFAGPTAVQQGTLAAGATNALGAASAYTIASGATLDLGGFNQTVASLGNAGSVRLGTAPGTTLTINGNYTGNGGTIFLNAALDGDASTTDKVVIHGSTSGTGILAVANVGGAGAQTVEGVKIVDVDGSSAGAFSLAGDYVFQGDQAVVSGAYAYRLYQNGVSTPTDGDWYLRSALINGSPNPLYSPAVPIYEAYPGVLQSLNELDTLQQRVGNRSWVGAAQGADEIGSVPTQNAIWARIEGAHTKQSPDSATTVSDYDVTTWKLETGVDGLLYEDATGILLGGVSFHYGTASSDISSIYGVGSIDAKGYGFAGTLTWYGDNGFYTDGQAQVTWYDSDLKSSSLGSELAKGNNGFGYAVSIEAGQKFALGAKWTLTPQAQLSYSSVSFDSFTDPFDAAVSLDSSEALIGRAGLSLDYEDAWTGVQGKVSRSHLYGVANLYYDFLDGNDVDVSGTALHEHDQPLWGGVGLGGSLSWNDDRYTVFGEAFAKSSLKEFGDSRSIGAKLGLSVNW